MERLHRTVAPTLPVARHTAQARQAPPLTNGGITSVPPAATRYEIREFDGPRVTIGQQQYRTGVHAFLVFPGARHGVTVRGPGERSC